MLNLNQKRNQYQIVPRLRRDRKATFTLRLTSMIDMFTILLVFLLKSYSTETQIMSVSPDLHLPISTAEKPPTTSSVIVVTPDWIILDGKPMLSVQKAIKSDKLLLKNLFEELRAKRLIAKRVSGLDARMAFQGKINIQADRDIPFVVLKKVMYTCGQVGYNNMALAVNTSNEL